MPFQSKRFPLRAKDYSDEKNTFGIFGLVSAHFPFFCINRMALFVRSPNFLDLCTSLGQSWSPVLLLACHQLDPVYRESIFPLTTCIALFSFVVQARIPGSRFYCLRDLEGRLLHGRFPPRLAECHIAIYNLFSGSITDSLCMFFV